MPATKVQLTGGQFQDSEGNKLALGYLLMKLAMDANISGVGNIASGVEIRIQLDSNGSVVAGQFVWGVDQMLPPNNYYRVTGYTEKGQPAWGPNNQQVVGSGGTFDVGTWVPNQVISWTPPLQNLELDTNGTLNPNQGRLNFQDTASVTWAVDGSGNLEASSAAGADLQVNGVDNTSQSVLDFEDTASVTWSNPSGGVVRATAVPQPPVLNTVFNNVHGWTVDMGTSQIVNYGSGLAAPNIGTSVFTPSTAGHPSKLHQTSQAVGGGQATLMTAFSVTPDINLNGLGFWKARAALASLSTGDEWYIGMTDVNLQSTYIQTTPTTQNVCAFRYIGGATNWGACVCDGLGTSTIVDTGIARDANMHTFLIVPNSNGTSIAFYIDGVLGATITTHIPTTNVGSNVSLKGNAAVQEFEYMWYGYND